MSDHLSPEQEDPEQRIRALERGLADVDRPAPLPDYGAAPTAGPAPSWSALPTSGARRSGPRWVAVLVGFLFPIAMLVVFAVPWKNVGFLDKLFGPTEVPHGGSLVVNDSDETKTIECNDGRLTLNGRNLAVTVTGHCVNLFVNGYDHQVTVDSADSIQVNGVNSIVVYHSGRPQISKNGSVTVQQG